ncbi:MAG: leucyl/phenylalanyl-tRNA--protein transferase [Pseudomonadota bacterium]
MKPLNTPALLFTADQAFPDPNTAMLDPNGLLAIGGDLSWQRLLLAYKNGIFPWFSKGEPILWWSPAPRMVLNLADLKISRSLKKSLANKQFQVSFNQTFEQVIQACAKPRKASQDTWITEEMIHAYIELHQRGHAMSVETWYQGNLVGGLYGVCVNRVFCGESMFSSMTDASKIALVHLVKKLKKQNYKLIDCQLYSPHLASLGAKEIRREVFLRLLRKR